MKRNGRMKGTRKYDKTRIQLSWDMLIKYKKWKVHAMLRQFVIEQLLFLAYIIITSSEILDFDQNQHFTSIIKITYYVKI